MSEEIVLNIALFTDNIIALRNSVNKLEDYMSKSETFDKTNITPFTHDLENMIQAIELLEQYKALFLEDITVIEDVGEKLREQDELLSKPTQTHDIMDGYQPVQA